MSHAYPLPGAFVRPVGRCGFKYRLEVIKAGPVDDASHSYWECRLWGDLPGNHPMHYLRGVLPVAPGLYRVTGMMYGKAPDPLYYRLTDRPANARLAGQLELF